MRAAAAIFLALGAALVGAAPGCSGDPDSSAVAAPPPTIGAPTAAVPRPPQVQLPPGSCCCESELRGDRVVRPAAEADCAAKSGRCLPAQDCWLPDPPQVSGR
jgi:hypothetical protein